MTGQVAIFSRGLWRLRHEVGLLSGLEPRLAVAMPWTLRAVAGWGHKPSADFARGAARHLGLPYLAFEDGFLRSLAPGPQQKPSAMVMDRTGIYYDARQPSDLELLLESGDIPEADCRMASDLVAFLSERCLSKYNDSDDHLPDGAVPRGRPIVLVIDQTRGDASVAGGLANDYNFETMMAAATAENPDATVVVKLHPETVSGRKAGYLAGRREGVHVLGGNINPHLLLALQPKVYTVSSQFGFEAVLAGCEVHCFGMPFYAGWGLTRDRLHIARRTRRRSRDELAAAALIRYGHYFDAWTRKPVSALEAAEQLDFQRRRHLANHRPVVAYRIARWKRRAVSAMLAGTAGPPRYIDRLPAAVAEARRSGAMLAAWGPTAAALRDAPAAKDVDILAVEDGFLRSSGLGAAFVQPRSLVFDSRGIYYDPTRASDLEVLLAGGRFTPEELLRADRLRSAIAAAGITKYNLGAGGAVPSPPPGREVVLVIGQVSDDAAVLAAARSCAVEHVGVNAWLLRKAREAAPSAFIIFKPHPDVVRLGRAGALTETEEAQADWIARTASIERLLPLADRVETFGSLAGFEALLRGRPVRVHGQPFYAGWGLTDDAAPLPRRGRTCSVPELVAAALIRYPRYWDPESGLTCPVETVLERLRGAQMPPRGLRPRVLATAGKLLIGWRRQRTAALAHLPRSPLRKGD